MKIAIFTDTFFPQISGVVTSTANLAKKLADRGNTVHIIAPRFKSNPSIDHKNIFIKRIPGFKAGFYEDFKFTLFMNPNIYRYLAKNKIDVIHFQTPLTLGFEAILASKILRKPLVGTFHTFFSDPEYLKHIKMDFSFFEKAGWYFNNFFYNRCDLVTTPTDYTKEALKDKGCKRKIKVISNGINTKKFDNSDKDKVKKKYNKNGPLILFVGRIAHEKNMSLLLDSFKEINKKVPSSKLMLIGDGPQMKDVKEKINELNLGKKVILMGKVPYEELIKSGIFGASKIFLTTSNTENQPMTLLEAQANGIVCVGPNKKGIPDLIKNNYNGFTFKPNSLNDCVNKVVRILKEKKTYEKFRKNTLREIEKHKMENVAEEWEKTYKMLIKNKNEK